MRNQGSWPDTAVKPGFTGPAESQTRVQTAENNRKQGSEGANGVRIPANTRRGFPGLEKRQTRVPRGRKEANKGSQGPRPRKPGFAARKNRKTGVRRATDENTPLR